jgi:prolyl oligopeptidase
LEETELMRVRLPLLSLAASLAVLMPAGAQAETPVASGGAGEAASSPYPTTRAENRVSRRFGETVADPYRWLEQDVRQSAEVRDWVDAQNGVTQAFLKTLPARETFAARIRAIMNFERMGVPRKGGNRYFFTRNNGLQNQSVLMVREGVNGAERLLLDPNGWAKDGATALAEWLPSPDGRYLLYAEQDGGTDWRTLRVIDVATGQALADEVKWVKFSDLSWKKDGSGFFYSRFAAPKEGAKFQATNLNQSVWMHAIGTSQDADVKIYATPQFPKRGHSAEVTDDGRYLLITTSEGTDSRYELHVARLDGASTTPPRPLVTGLNNDWKLAGSVGSLFTFRTDLNAPRGRLVTIDVDAPTPVPQEIVAQSADTMVGASMVGKRLIVAYLGDAKSEAELRTLDGKLVAPIRLPGIGSAAGFGGAAGDAETFYSFSSFAVAPTVYRFNTDTGEADIFFQPKTAFNADDFVTDQKFYTSKDGTRVPVFLISRKDRKGAAPALLYGYGGFNSPQTPGFNAQRLAWVDQGGVLAIANLRGGGEYGKDWHDAGRLARKQNVFDDFIAAGEYLISEGITEKGKLAIEGRSNGGLLIGAVVNQRPDLFAAALPVVGVMDMLRFNRFTAGRYWVDDYGDPAKKADFKVLRAYSPYHNIRPGSDYPAIMVMTADTDDRVVPGHSFKYAAALQTAQPGGKPKLIRIDTRSGHGSGKPTDKLIAEFADAYAFIAHFTGLETN